MGLGKTVQTSAFLGYLAEAQQCRGPFLVMVPLSTVPNWAREFRRWLPQMNLVVYIGDAASREVIRGFEFSNEGGNRRARPHGFEVLLTTYEMALKDGGILSRIRWEYLLVDEAHRLKNAESALYTELMGWTFENKLLITGTPLQNSMKELWALLHFLDSERFPDADSFEEAYGMGATGQGTDKLARLHEELR